MCRSTAASAAPNTSTPSKTPTQDELAEWAPKLLAKLRTLPELTDVASDQQSGGLQISVDVDRDQASRLNVLPQAIDDTLYDAFGQRQVSTIFTQLNQYRVILEADAAIPARHPSRSTRSTSNPSTGQMVPLERVCPSATTVTAPLAISHRGPVPRRHALLQSAPGQFPGRGRGRHPARRRRKSACPKPSTTSFSGSAAEFRSSLKSEPLLILAAIVVIYIVLGVLYESYIHPITILSSLPSAGVGALLALMICHTDLSLVALIGIILLIGIVKKNAIMMIDFALDAERNEGLPPEKSIYQACLLRFRPIMMTTMAALLGALPLALETAPARNCAARSASPSSAACSFRSSSRFTPPRSSTSTSTASAAGPQTPRRRAATPAANAGGLPEPAAGEP